MQNWPWRSAFYFLRRDFFCTRDERAKMKYWLNFCCDYCEIFLYFYLPESLELSNVNNCPVDCEKINYEAQLSTALYVPQKLLPLTKHSYLTRAKHMPNDTEGRVQFLLWVFCIIYLWFLAFLFNNLTFLKSFMIRDVTEDKGGPRILL